MDSQTRSNLRLRAIRHRLYRVAYECNQGKRDHLGRLIVALPGGMNIKEYTGMTASSRACHVSNPLSTWLSTGLLLNREGVLANRT